VIYLLLISSALGILTYVLGALIYALPIPIRGLKRWAPLLISDGILVFTLSMTFSLILWLMDYVYSVIGVSRESLVKDIILIAKSISRLYMSLMLLKKLISLVSSSYLLGKLGGNVIAVLFSLLGLAWPLQSVLLQPMLDLILGMLRLGVYLWTSLYILSKFGELLSPLMIAIGIVMLALPFRVGRLAGANLIGFSISAYVVTPLVIPLVQLIISYNPSLLHLWNSFINLSKLTADVVYPYGKITDMHGKPLDYIAVHFCDPRGVCGIYPTDDKGRYATVVELGGAPYPVTNLYLDIYGIKSKVKRIDFRYFNVHKSDVIRMDVRFDDVQRVQDFLILVRRSGDVAVTDSKVYEAQGYVKVILRVSGTGKGIISTYGTFDPSTFSVAASRSFSNITIERTKWMNGDALHVYFYVVGGGELAFTSKLKVESAPKITAQGYLASKMGLIGNELKGISNAEDPFPLPLLVTVIPALHLAIVVLVGRGIASLISGTSKTIISRVW